jgi:anti-anti-sigma factor
MTSKVTCKRESDTLTFRITGNFNYAIVLGVKKLVEQQKKADKYVIDLAGVTHINSSAFGALIYIKETYGAGDNDISIINSSPEVVKMLKGVNFHQLFQIV